MGILHYNEVCMKASHNSYQKNETIIEQLTWYDENKFNCGCRAIELDISQSKYSKDWSVGHTDSYDVHCRQLSQFLSDLMSWSNNNPNHNVITIHLDLKHIATDNFPSDLDQYIKEHFPVKIYTPGELIGNSVNLSQGAVNNGWPIIDELKGKFIICLTGDSNAKATYANTLPKERLCFADKDANLDIEPKDSNRVFFNFHIYHDERDKWIETIKKCAGKPNKIIRTYIANSKENWVDCLSSGCNLIATDKISNHTWAKVGNNPFERLINK